MIDRFYENFCKYLTNDDIKKIKNDYRNYYDKVKKSRNKVYKKFCYDYKHINNLVKKNNKIFVLNEIKESKYLFNIDRFTLDLNQQKIVVTDSKNILVIAGAGSGKTLTIIGKIRYLIERKKIKEYEILCISFTNDATNSLKNKLKSKYNYDIEVLTFHKLALKIIKKQMDIEIAPSDYLDYIIDEYFSSIILENEVLMLKLLYYFKVKKINNIKEDYLRYIVENPFELSNLKKLISQFIHLFKANAYEMNIYQKWLKKNFLFKLIYSIHKIYEVELNSSNQVDFDDMILLASKLVYKSNLKYKYIIIDEYQDTSKTRFLLIKNLLEYTNSKLLAVGDDFQSIYRFTGCDLNIFLNFKKYFDETKILKIENTYRNSFELIKIASKFILKNKRQMYKSLKSNKRLNKPIKIVYYNNRKYMFKKLLNYVIENNTGDIMIIGRNNNDINLFIDSDFKLENNGKLVYKDSITNIRYLTAHKSKGLECDNVIIINLEDKVLGFPSKLEDEKILKYVLNSKIVFPYEEERRLFYVALTRTKNNVYLLSPYQRKSIFVKELLSDFSIPVIEL